MARPFVRTLLGKIMAAALCLYGGAAVEAVDYKIVTANEKALILRSAPISPSSSPPMPPSCWRFYLRRVRPQILSIFATTRA